VSEIFMIRTQSGLTPADQHEWEELAGDRIKIGDEVKCEITVPRNYRFLKKYMVMIKTSFEMQDQFKNIKHWRDAVQIAAGHCETYITHEGKVNYKPKSVSFAHCDETEFNKVYNDAIQAICDHWLTSDADSYKLILGFV